MSYQYCFCPTCATRRVASGLRCSVGGPVRHADRPVAAAMPAGSGGRRPFSTGWRKVTTQEAGEAMRKLGEA